MRSSDGSDLPIFAPPGRSQSIPPDIHNTARQTRARYEYQDECIALLLLQNLADRLDGVLIEHSTDVIVFSADEPPELISIKHREPNHSAGSSWDWPALKKDKVFDDLYRAWKSAGEDCSVSFYSNAGFSGSAQMIWRASAKRDEGAQAKAQADLQRRLDIPAKEASDFLASIALPESPLPRRNEISDVAIRLTSSYLRSHGRSESHARNCYSKLLNRIREAGTETPEARTNLQRKTYATVRARVRNLAADELKKRWISRKDVHRLILFEADRAQSAALSATGHPGWEPDPLFTGRTAELQALDSLLCIGEPDPVPPVVLHGMSGIGKTALAVHFAASQPNEMVVKFLDGSSRASLIDDLNQLAGERFEADSFTVSPSGIATSPRLPFSAATILIIDGVTNAADVRGIIPRSSICRVIVTSTSRHIDEGFSELFVGSWSKGEAIDFCHKAVPKESCSSLNALAEKLGSHPLAINQAINYCKTTDISVAEYLQRFASFPQRILDSGAAAGHPMTLTRTVTLASDALTSTCPLALDLLKILSHMGPGPVPIHLFEKEPIRPFVADGRPARKDWFSLRKSNRFPVWGGFSGSEEGWKARQELHNALDRDKAVVALQKFGLISVAAGYLSAHPLTQTVVRESVDKKSPWIETALGLMASLLPVDDALRSTRLHKHTGAAVSVIRHALSEGLTGPAVIMTGAVLSEELCKIGEHGEALTLAREIYETAKLRYAEGRAKPNIMFYVRKSLSTALLMNEQMTAAFEMANENISMAENDCTDQASRLMAYIDLGRTVVKAQLIDKAEHALWYIPDPSRYESATRPENIEMALRMAHIRTRLLILLNREEEALKSNSWAKGQLVNILDPKTRHYLTLALNSDGAVLARHFADNESSIQLQESLTEEMLSVDAERSDPEYIEALLDLTDGYLENLDAESADRTLEEVAILVQFDEEDRGSLRAKCLSTLGKRSLLGATPGSPEVVEGIRMLKDSVNMFKAAPTSLRGPLAAALINLAGGYALMGELERALPCAHEALKLDEMTYPSDHPEVVIDKEIIRFLPLQATMSRAVITGHFGGVGGENGSGVL